ncbi:MAG TPA: M20/M25/M40 family metallo-hydrolase, partial [Myxococcota bacterium]
WYPHTQAQIKSADGGELVTSKVKVTGMPAGWRALSEGDGAGANAWISTTPADNIHLVAGPFHETKERKHGVDVLIWLRSEDTDQQQLAQRYLEVTGQYLAMYDDLIGPYPYAKFALVENFWETGYGMPSFTLLGPQVIRFPFILHTSWPHELLHNWWGNGVFVSPGAGNWSEGLTAYLSDQLDAEQNGKGDEYRRTTLQRYQDFVAVDAKKDFPLTKFTARFSAASEAVGYGKWLMAVHMLRIKLGDDAFKGGLKKLWHDHRFERADFDDVRAAFQPGSATDLAPWFAAWTQRTGAPTVRWSDVRDVKDHTGAHHLEIAIAQTQADPAFPLDVPVVVTTRSGRGIRGVVAMDGSTKIARTSIALPDAAARVDVDPFADTFRALLPGEAAPSLSRALGAQRVLFVMPTLASVEERAAWKRFMDAVCGDGAQCSAVDDKAVTAIPNNSAVWILGYGNDLRAAAVVSAARFGAHDDDRGFLAPGPWTFDRVKNERTDPGKTSLVLALAHPRGGEEGAVFVGAHTAKAIDLLAKKIPHYGKYGYLAFAGDAVENSLKGTWEPDASPMTVFLSSAHVPMAPKMAAPILVALPPPFDSERMVDDVKALSALNGRSNGSKDLDDALSLVDKGLSTAGLASKRWCATAKNDACALVASIAGTDAALPHVVLSAHVDHLGRVKNEVYPGADDDASGVAVVLEVARALKKAGPFARTIDVALFTGEEQGLKGSRAYVKSLGADAKAVVFADVNLDVVGRRGDKPLLVLDGDSASEWVHIFRGVGFTTGVPVELGKQGGGASDQQAFLEAGVPGVQLFSGANTDYHRPTDT